MIQIVENEKAPKVECRASSYPEATYVWQHDGETVYKGPVLVMNHNIRRQQAGEYLCIAQNRHGQMTETTNFDILCECPVQNVLRVCVC